jgi:hypothetical protein
MAMAEFKNSLFMVFRLHALKDKFFFLRETFERLLVSQIPPLITDEIYRRSRIDVKQIGIQGWWNTGTQYLFTLFPIFLGTTMIQD